MSHSRRTLLGVALLAGTLLAVLVPALSHASASGNDGVIAFSAEVHGVSQVFTIEPDGTQQRQVTHGAPAGQYGLAWSPDGHSLLFSVAHHGKDRLTRSHANGSDPTNVSAPCKGTCLGDDAASYSPNGKTIGFERAFGPIVNNNASGVEIFTTNADGGDLKQLTKSASEDHQPRWSPDGKTIAFVQFDVAKGESAIEVMNADGSNVRRLTPYAIGASDPRWSPNGKLLLYSTYSEPVRGQSSNLFTMHPDGTHRVAITHYKGGAINAFADDWSPNGKQVLFRRFKFSGTDTEVGGYYILDLGSKHIKRLTPVRLTGDAEAAWGR